MVSMKKLFRDELMHLTILLGLLRIDPYSSELGRDYDLNVIPDTLVLGSSSALAYRNGLLLLNGMRHRSIVHPKNLIHETMLLDQSEIFYELNALGRYDRYRSLTPEVTTYLLCRQEPLSAATTTTAAVTTAVVNQQQQIEQHAPETNVTENGPSQSALETPVVVSQPDPSVEDVVHEELVQVTDQMSDCLALAGDMSKEDMDLIDILLRQDIDLGVTRDVFDVQLRKEVIVDEPGDDDHEPTPLIEVVKSKDEKQATATSAADFDVDRVLDPWYGLNYTIDSETGEHVVLDEEPGPSSSSSSETGTGAVFFGTTSPPELLSLTDELETIPLDDLSLVDIPEDNDQDKVESKDSADEGLDLDLPSLASEQGAFVEELKELEEMIQSAQLHHSGRLQPRVQYLRSVSMEQRWQDLTNFMSYPPPPPPSSSDAEMHHHHHHHHHHNMGMGMLHNGSTAVGGPAAVHGHIVSQHNYTLPNYGIDNRTSSVLIQNATLPPPVADINSNMTFPGEVGGGDSTNVGAAVVTSMSTLANGSDSMADTAPHAHYQMDAGAMMFPGNHTEVNQTTEGFLSSILNDEDLQLMDMAMNEGMYTMRMLENDDAMDTSSDSAVSSMGSSERVPSTSDGEWMEATTGSPHPAEEQDQRYYGMEHKYRPYNYSYAPGMAPTSHHRSNHPGGGSGGGGTPTDESAAGMDRRMPPVAQKKYQLFGKRVGMEQPMGGVTYGALPRGSASMPQPTAPMKYPGYLYPGVQDHNSSSSYGSLEGATAPNTSVGPVETKYSCSLEFARQHPVTGSPAALNHIQHNHTYELPSSGVADAHRPTVRDKHKKASAAAAAAAALAGNPGEDHLPRDEKRARAMKIPLSTDEIINLPMDEFNERLSKYDLTEPQLALIRDIRRRGKNKVAAQNCRKRKLDQILTLADEVQRMHHERERLMHQQQTFISERQRMKDKFSQLYRHVFQSLRDPDGNPYSPYEYSLQQAADGNILLVPRNGTVNMELQETCKGGSKNKGGGGRKEEVKK